MDWAASLPFVLMVAGAVTSAAPLVATRHFGANNKALGIFCAVGSWVCVWSGVVLALSGFVMLVAPM